MVRSAVEYRFELDEGRSWAVDYALSEIQRLQKQLIEGNDDIPGDEDIINLYDLGFELTHWRKGNNHMLWEKIIKDDKEAIAVALNEALPSVDVVILNAGTSKGGEDFCYQYLKENGNMLFHGVAAVPGRPMSLTTENEQLDGKLRITTVQRNQIQLLIKTCS